MEKAMTFEEFCFVFPQEGEVPIERRKELYKRIAKTIRQREELIDALMKAVGYDGDQMEEINLNFLNKACDLAIKMKGGE